MFYFEARFSEKNKEKALNVLATVIQSQNILFSYTSNYYICYHLENPIINALVLDLKKNDVFYFVCYYKF